MTKSAPQMPMTGARPTATPKIRVAEARTRSHASLTQGLADLILNRTIEPFDRQAAALLTLDTLAGALAGRASETGIVARQWFESLGPGARSDPGREALLVGTLAHIMETDDLHRASVTHPGAVVVPAAWAAASHFKLSGRDYLDAVVRGYEAMTRIGRATGSEHYKFFHKTATVGPFGAAAAVGSLMGLDEAQMTDAFGTAGTQAAGLWQCLDTGAMTKPFHAGRAAEAGWLAASLAAHDFMGPDKILEGAQGFFAATCGADCDPGAVLRGSQEPWAVHQTSIKPWPSCRHTHAAIDAASELRAQILERGQSAMDIGAVHVRTYPAGIHLCDRISPKTETDAKFSLQHCVAAALGGAHVSFDSFEEPARKALAPIRARVTLVPEPRYEKAYPGAWGATVAVTMRDGTHLDAERPHAKGDPEAPMGHEELTEKARMLMEFSEADDAEALIEICMHLDKVPAVPSLGLYWYGASP